MRYKKPKYVIEDVGPDGVVRFYFRRRKGHKKIRLHGLPWTPSFMAEYEAALNQTAIPKDGTAKKRQKGTLGWLCHKYCEDSIAFGKLDERTQRVRRGILDAICDATTTSESIIKMGTIPMAAITPKAIRVLRDRIGRKHPEQANSWVKALRQVFKHAVEQEYLTNNPTRDVPYLSSDSEGFHTWTIEEVEDFESAHPVGTKARLALALMLYTGQRRSDAVRFGPDHVKDGWLIFTQWKNRNRKPVRMEIPIRPELQAAIDATECGEITFLVTEFGKPFSANGFGNWFRKRCDEAGLPQCTAHGLRKAAAARLAELGAPENEIMAITGHRTSKEITRYTRGARQRTLAEHAMARHAKGDGK